MPPGRIKNVIEFQEEIDSEKIDAAQVFKDEIRNVTEYNARLNAFITIFDEDSARSISQIGEHDGSEKFQSKKDFVRKKAGRKRSPFTAYP